MWPNDNLRQSRSREVYPMGNWGQSRRLIFNALVYALPDGAGLFGIIARLRSPSNRCANQIAIAKASHNRREFPQCSGDQYPPRCRHHRFKVLKLAQQLGRRLVRCQL
jgi:hypothetical protein